MTFKELKFNSKYIKFALNKITNPKINNIKNISNKNISNKDINKNKILFNISNKEQLSMYIKGLNSINKYLRDSISN